MNAKKQSFFDKLLKANSDETDEIKKKIRAKAQEEEPVDVDVEENEDEDNTEEEIETQKGKEATWEDEEAEGQLTIDVYQTDTHIVIQSTIAGVNPEDIDVSVNGDMVTIRGTRKKDQSIKEEDYYYQECYWGSFSRSIILPVDIDPNKIDASLKNGILTIKIPRADKARIRKVKIKMG